METSDGNACILEQMNTVNDDNTMILSTLMYEIFHNMIEIVLNICVVYSNNVWVI